MSEANGDRLHIKLHVYDTSMSVTVPRKDEELYRRCAKLVTDIVNSYSAVFKGRKSDKEILYMALIDEKESRRHDAMPFNDILGKLTSEIEEALK